MNLRMSPRNASARLGLELSSRLGLALELLLLVSFTYSPRPTASSLSNRKPDRAITAAILHAPRKFRSDVLENVVRLRVSFSYCGNLQYLMATTTYLELERSFFILKHYDSGGFSLLPLTAQPVPDHLGRGLHRQARSYSALRLTITSRRPRLQVRHPHLTRDRERDSRFNSS